MPEYIEGIYTAFALLYNLANDIDSGVYYSPICVFIV